MLAQVLLHHPQKRAVVGKLWGDHIGVAFVDPSKTILREEVCQRLPAAFAREHHVLPLYELAGAVTVATPTPLDRTLIAGIESRMNAFVSPVFAFADQVDAAIEIIYQSDSALMKLVEAFASKVGQAGVRINAREIRKLSQEQAVTDFVRGLLLYAVKRRASDIHIEPGEEQVRIRFRIDGVLQPIFTLDAALLAPVGTHLKLLAEVDIAESRQPQDGRVELKTPGDPIVLRFSSAPTIHGEKFVLRLMGTPGFQDVPSLGDLGFSSVIEPGVRRVAESPNGVFFVTGPTGSGKTTTLYALLQYMNNPGVNIMTIENPVERPLTGINQSQVNDDIGLTFGALLRNFLRQDPDIILLGEVRDLETAQIAARAALTGHLVLTTMHTNDAIQTVTRLLDLGVDPSLAAPCLIGVLAQRLVRQLCGACKESYTLTRAQMEEIFEFEGEPEVSFHRAVGCELCNRTGYRGRLGIHELLTITPEVRALISRHASYPEILACAESQGFDSLRYDGVKKVLRGLTSIEEVSRVVL
jgi:type IV pilus assembly protein PilB